MRLLVCIHLVVVTAFGPAVCCCAPGRLAAALNRLVGREGATSARPHPCCGGGNLAPLAEKSSGKSAWADTRSSPGDRDGPGEPCPCRQGGSVKSVDAPDPRAEAHPEGSFPAAWVVPGPAAVRAQPEALRPGNPHGPPPFSAPVRAPHVLRC